MDPDQTAPLIRLHSVCFHDKIDSEVLLNIYNSHRKYCKICVKRSQKDLKLVSKTNYSLMQVKSREHSAILWTFIKLPFVLKIFVLSIFEWPFYTGFTVDKKYCQYKDEAYALISSR